MTFCDEVVKMILALSVVNVNYSEHTSLIFEWLKASAYHVDAKSKPMGINVVEQFTVSPKSILDSLVIMVCLRYHCKSHTDVQCTVFSITKPLWCKTQTP